MPQGLSAAWRVRAPHEPLHVPCLQPTPTWVRGTRARGDAEVRAQTYSSGNIVSASSTAATSQSSRTRPLTLCLSFPLRNTGLQPPFW